MNTGKMIFSHVISFLPKYEFQKIVAKYRGNHKVREFSCWDQFLCMAFAQLTYRNSLRDTVVCLRAMQSKLYHMGFVVMYPEVPWHMPIRNGIGEYMLNLLKY